LLKVAINTQKPNPYRGDGTDCTGSCKANYHTIMTMTAPDPDKTTSTIFKVTDNFKISEISI
jgi:hypothetical protein